MSVRQARAYVFQRFSNRIRNLRAVLSKSADQRTLPEKLLISGTLTTIEHIVRITFRLSSTLIVTRLLAPDIFGLFAIIITFQTILALITDFGIRDLILTSRDFREPSFLRTCWSVQVARGFAIYGIILGLCACIYLLQSQGILAGDSVYGASVLPAALAASGLQMVLQGFWSVNMHVYAKEMRFRLITTLNILVALATPMLTILIALIHPTVWALVIAGLLGSILNLLLTHYLFDGPSMGFCWNKGYRKVLFDRGKWIVGRSSLTVATKQADQIILSAFLPASLFGVYFLARQIFMVPETLVQKLHNSFGLQFFREIISLPRRQDMHRKYYKYRVPMDAVTCLFTGGFLTAAPAVIELMYDPRYEDAGYILQILALGLPLFGLGMVRQAFDARQQFKITAGFSLIRTITIWTGMAVALIAFESPLAAFFVIALHRIPEIATLLFYARREGWVDLVKEFRVFPLIGVGALMGWGLSGLIELVV